MKVKLQSQIDMNHWTVVFVDGPWKDQTGDYRIETQNLDAGQTVEVEVEVTHYMKFKGPSSNGYCGRLNVQKTVTEPEKQVAVNKRAKRK